jgi:hypothetical protein
MEEVITVVLGGIVFVTPWWSFSKIRYFSKHDSHVSLKSDTSLRPPVKLRWSAFSLHTDGNNLGR